MRYTITHALVMLIFSGSLITAIALIFDFMIKQGVPYREYRGAAHLLWSADTF